MSYNLQQPTISIKTFVFILIVLDVDAASVIRRAFVVPSNTILSIELRRDASMPSVPEEITPPILALHQS